MIRQIQHTHRVETYEMAVRLFKFLCIGGVGAMVNLQSIDLDAVQSHGYAFQVELTYRVMMQGFQMVETPIVFRDRRCGKSKMSHAIILEALTYVLRTRLRQQAAPIPHAASTNHAKRWS